MPSHGGDPRSPLWLGPVGSSSSGLPDHFLEPSAVYLACDIEMANDTQDSDLAYLVDVLAHAIAKDYGGLAPAFFRASVEDVLVALAAFGLDPSTIRRALAFNPGSQSDSQH